MSDLEDGDQGGADDAPSEQRRGRLVRLSLWFDRNKGTVIALALLGVFVTTAVLGVGVPRPVTLVGVAACGAYIFPGGQVGSQVENYLPDPPMVLAVDVRSERVQEAKAYLIPLERFSRYECTEGEPARPNPQLAFVRDLDQDAMTFKGTWPGTLTEREMIQHVIRVKECRQILEPMAKAGEAINSSAFIIVRSAALSAVKRIAETFESGSLPDEGDGVTAAIDGVLEDYGMSRDDYMTDVLEKQDGAPDIDFEDADLEDIDFGQIEITENGPAWKLEGDGLETGDADD